MSDRLLTQENPNPHLTPPPDLRRCAPYYMINEPVAPVAVLDAAVTDMLDGRGLHSSTFRLNL